MHQSGSRICDREGCQEEALSFSGHCWEHVQKETFISELKEGLLSLSQEDTPRALNLKKAHLSDLDFSTLKIEGSNFSQCFISGCSFIGSNLSESNFIGTRINSCDFVGADIYRANFTKANFSSTSFSHADLRGAYFVEAHFRDTDFMGAILFDSVLWNSDLSGAHHIKQNSFKNPDSKKKRASYHLNESHALGAYESYRSVKHYFYRNGLYEAGGWAAYRELTMERKYFFEKRDFRYIPSLLMDLLSGYTEKPGRVIFSSLAIVFLFGLVYYLLDIPAVAHNGLMSRAGFWDSVYFSFITFTTVGYGDITPKAIIGFRLLACAEAFSGPFMAGLYIFTLTRRYAAT